MNSLIVPTISMLSLIVGSLICANQQSQLLADDGPLDRFGDIRERDDDSDVDAIRLVQHQKEAFYSQWNTNDWVRTLSSVEAQTHVTGADFIDAVISMLVRSTPEDRRKLFGTIRKEWMFDHETSGEIRAKQLCRFLNLFSRLGVEKADTTLTQFVGWWVSRLGRVSDDGFRGPIVSWAATIDNSERLGKVLLTLADSSFFSSLAGQRDATGTVVEIKTLPTWLGLWHDQMDRVTDPITKMDLLAVYIGKRDVGRILLRCGRADLLSAYRDGVTEDVHTRRFVSQMFAEGYALSAVIAAGDFQHLDRLTAAWATQDDEGERLRAEFLTSPIVYEKLLETKRSAEVTDFIRQVSTANIAITLSNMVKVFDPAIADRNLVAVLCDRIDRLPVELPFSQPAECYRFRRYVGGLKRDRYIPKLDEFQIAEKRDYLVERVVEALLASDAFFDLLQSGDDRLPKLVAWMKFLVKPERVGHCLAMMFNRDDATKMLNRLGRDQVYSVLETESDWLTIYQVRNILNSPSLVQDARQHGFAERLYQSVSIITKRNPMDTESRSVDIIQSPLASGLCQAGYARRLLDLLLVETHPLPKGSCYALLVSKDFSNSFLQSNTSSELLDRLLTRESVAETSYLVWTVLQNEALVKELGRTGDFPRLIHWLVGLGDTERKLQLAEAIISTEAAYDYLSDEEVKQLMSVVTPLEVIQTKWFRHVILDSESMTNRLFRLGFKEELLKWIDSETPQFRSLGKPHVFDLIGEQRRQAAFRVLEAEVARKPDDRSPAFHKIIPQYLERYGFRKFMSFVSPDEKQFWNCVPTQDDFIASSLRRGEYHLLFELLPEYRFRFHFDGLQRFLASPQAKAVLGSDIALHDLLKLPSHEGGRKALGLEQVATAFAEAGLQQEYTEALSEIDRNIKPNTQ